MSDELFRLLWQADTLLRWWQNGSQPDSETSEFLAAVEKVIKQRATDREPENG